MLWGTLACAMLAGGLAAAPAQAQSCFLIVFCARTPPPPPPPPCADGIDNDKDGQADLHDAGCATWKDQDESDDLAPDANGQPRGPDVDPATSGRLFGFNSALGLWSSGITAAQEAPLIMQAGGFAQRLGVQWSHYQPTAAPPLADRLARLDASYLHLAGRGMYPILSVSSAPVWASWLATCAPSDSTCQALRRDPPRNLPPIDVPSFAKFMAFLAARYPGAILETWNEPNIERFWNDPSFPNVTRMAAMQCEAYAAIKRVRSSALVASPGFAFIGGWPADGQIPYVDYVAGVHAKQGRRCWDGLSAHVYPTSNVDGPGSSTAFAMRAIKTIRQRYGDTTPIWITETGASTTGSPGGDHGHTRRTPEEQRRMIRLTINELLTTPEVQMVLLHSLRDRPSNDEWANNGVAAQYGFGAMYATSDPQPKPIWCHLMKVRAKAWPGCLDGEVTQPPPGS